MQTVLVIIIMAVAAGYAALRVYRAFSAPPDPCAGCSGCELKKKWWKILSIQRKVVTLHPLRQNGALDEWLSQRSAKPSTAVRIHQAPLKKEDSLGNLPFFIVLFASLRCTISVDAVWSARQSSHCRYRRCSADRGRCPPRSSALSLSLSVPSASW